MWGIAQKHLDDWVQMGNRQPTANQQLEVSTMIAKVLGVVLIPLVALVPLIALDLAVENAADAFSYLMILVSSVTVVALIVTMLRLATRSVVARSSNGSPRSSWHWLP